LEAFISREVQVHVMAHSARRACSLTYREHIELSTRQKVGSWAWPHSLRKKSIKTNAQRSDNVCQLLWLQNGLVTRQRALLLVDGTPGVMLQRAHWMAASRARKVVTGIWGSLSMQNRDLITTARGFDPNDVKLTITFFK